MTDQSRGSIRASAEQSVTFVELFFDLVFVFAVTQLTVLTAHDLTPGGILRSILLGWLIWWAWTQFTWTLNPADTTHPTVRVVTLAATGTALVMAASVPRAFADDALWFALPYVLVRVLGLGLQVLVELDRVAESHAGVFRWAGLSSVGLVLVIAGAIVDPTMRPWIWLLAILADIVAAARAGRSTTWDLNPAHLSERHGLFVIIAIGESLIVAGTAVANDERTGALAAAAAASIVVAALLWWTYFGWLGCPRASLRGRAARAERSARTRCVQPGPLPADRRHRWVRRCHRGDRGPSGRTGARRSDGIARGRRGAVRSQLCAVTPAMWR